MSFVALASRVIIPLQIFLAFFFLFRGHNLPGGGFIGGLLLGLSLVLALLGFGFQRIKEAIPFEPSTVIGIGLFTAGISSFFGPLFGKGIFTGVWGSTVPFIGKLSSVLLLDVGVFLLVAGIVMKVVYSLMEEEC